MIVLVIILLTTRDPDMSDPADTNRRHFLGLVSALSVAGLAPAQILAQGSMPRRPIPSTGEMLPVIGLGSSKVVSMIGTAGTDPVAQVLRTLVEHGGAVVDTWPRDPENDAAFGRVISAPDLREALFVTTKIDREGKEAGVAQFQEALRNYGRNPIDLAQIFSLTDLATHWPSLREWKDSGQARYIGVTVSQYELYPELEAFLARNTPDFVQMNYSITERRAEDRLLPLAADRGIAVLINRPFMNGSYFGRLETRPLPEWTAEFGCESWAQFSLKYILAHPAITTVLTETSNPHHMAENAATAGGPLPDDAQGALMRRYIDEV
jgi:diketogulonate reductase-like aldo/keto reductase